MIVHVFTANRYHLVPTISKGFATTYVEDAHHRFILHGSQDLDENLYRKIFEEVGFTDFYFSHSISELVRLLRKNHSYPILFHAGSYSYFIWSFIVGCSNVNWVCWGSGASTRKSWKSRCFALIKKLIYKRFKTIITLMDDDRTTLVENFGLDINKIFTIPYASGGEKSPRDKISLELLNCESEKREKPVVLLGNNPSNMGYYKKMLKKLSCFKGKIKVHCMMNYSLEKDDSYQNFLNLGQSLFGDDFRSEEDFYKGDDYVRYMNSCDIYICGNPAQSGLGAIATCMLLGKKIYLTGKNLNWMRSHYHAKVFDVCEIKDYETFISPLTMDEKLYNRNEYIRQRQLSPKLWHQYLRKIDK